MEYEIVFCTDSILRLKFSNKPMIPLTFIQKEAKLNNDFSFWVRWWNQNVIFEEGLTFGQFLKCLEPWASFFQELTGKDIQGFINESRRPTLVQDTKEEQLTWISLSYITTISADLEYKDLLSKSDSINEWLNNPKEARLNGLWSIYNEYKLTGYKEGYEEHYSIEGSPMNELTNLPLILNQHQILLVETFNEKRILGKDYKLFSRDSYGTREIKDKDNKHNVFEYIEGLKSHKFKTVIEAFFFWFHSDPESRESFNEELREIFNKVKDNDKEEDSKTVTIEDIDSNNIKEVRVVPGAFDSIIADFEYQKDYWEKMLDKTKSDNNVILKIGEFKEAVSSEKRLLSYIIDNKSLATDFKKI